MERIKEKLDFSKERILMIERAFEKGIKSELEKFGIYKLFQELCESIFDAITIFLKTKGIEPKDKYTNIKILHELEIIDEKEKQILVQANGLRNWIIHRYNKFSEEIAMKSIEELLPKLNEIVERFKKCLK